jgi:hypothetical protein
LVPSPATQTPRAALLSALFEGARVAVLAGDLDTARIAHEAIGKLLGVADLAASGAPAEEPRRREH